MGLLCAVGTFHPSVRSVFVQENLYIGMQMDNKGQLWNTSRAELVGQLPTSTSCAISSPIEYYNHAWINRLCQTVPYLNSARMIPNARQSSLSSCSLPKNTFQSPRMVVAFPCPLSPSLPATLSTPLYPRSALTRRLRDRHLLFSRS